MTDKRQRRCVRADSVCFTQQRKPGGVKTKKLHKLCGCRFESQTRSPAERRRFLQQLHPDEIYLAVMEIVGGEV